MAKRKNKQTNTVTDEQVTPKSHKKSKKTSVNAANVITSKIPYIHCYEEHGMFEIEHNKYSVT